MVEPNRVLTLVAGLLLAGASLARADGLDDGARGIGAEGRRLERELEALEELEEPDLTWPPSYPVADGWSVQPLPPTDLYPRYVADPRRPRISLAYHSLIGSGIEDGGNSRVSAMAGGRYGFFRVHPTDDPDTGLQFDAEVAILAHFDKSRSLDCVGWDGFFGFSLSWRPTPELAFRFAANHDSAHVGDEFAEEFGRERIDYTREEFAFGVSWEPIDVVRFYAEAGYSLSKNTDGQKPVRVQVGAEYETREPVLWGAHWFAAVDAVFWQENDWEPSVTVMSGLVWHRDVIGRAWRVGLQYYDGRALLGEFFREDERWVALGFWFDL